MRRLAIGITLLIGLGLALAGCSGGKEPTATGKTPGPLHVLTSTFPMVLFTRSVTTGATGVSLESMLSGSMGCPHDYVLTPQDMQKIARADVFVVNGLGLEEFLGAPVKSANPGVRVLDTSKGITDLLKMTPEEGTEESGKEPHHHQGDANPHLFASPRMAAKVVRNIAAQLSEIDPSNRRVYLDNAEREAAKLEKLADEFASAGKRLRSRKIVTEHAVFDYLARDAGLEIVAVVEETPGQEPSAARMLDIVKLIRSSGAAAVFTEPQYPAKVAETIAKEARVPVAQLDPAASGPDDAPADYYEQVMRKNLDTLKSSLGGP
jgi:ABC-type Zn uptake system ZnuABC Zn-binding protein ZnuA